MTKKIKKLFKTKKVVQKKKKIFKSTKFSPKKKHKLFYTIYCNENYQQKTPKLEFTKSKLFNILKIKDTKKNTVIKTQNTKLMNTFENRGKWSQEENRAFVEGILKYGNNWKQIQTDIPTRTWLQIKTHAQKFFLKLQRISIPIVYLNYSYSTVNYFQKMLLSLNKEKLDEVITILGQLFNIPHRCHKKTKINNYEKIEYNINESNCKNNETFFHNFSNPTQVEVAYILNTFINNFTNDDLNEYNQFSLSDNNLFKDFFDVFPDHFQNNSLNNINRNIDYNIKCSLNNHNQSRKNSSSVFKFYDEKC